jgi:hypothetical protein
MYYHDSLLQSDKQVLGDDDPRFPCAIKCLTAWILALQPSPQQQTQRL